MCRLFLYICMQYQFRQRLFCNNSGDPVYNKYTFVRNNHCQLSLRIHKVIFTDFSMIVHGKQNA
jgi:hypothetical protein